MGNPIGFLQGPTGFRRNPLWDPYRVVQDSIIIILEYHWKPIRSLQGPAGFNRNLIGISLQSHKVPTGSYRIP
eukprot:9495951-Pyramimonas_sp.AAC.2